MRLTPNQLEHLHELSTALARPTGDTDALVKHGLAERGKGKFGEWVRITAKGRIENSRMMRDRGSAPAPTVSPRSAKTRVQSMPAPATPLPSAPTSAAPPGCVSQGPAPNTAAARSSVSDAPLVRADVAAVPHAGVKTLRIYRVAYLDTLGLKSTGFTWHRSEREARSAAYAKRELHPNILSVDIATNKEGIIDALMRFASHPK